MEFNNKQTNKHLSMDVSYKELEILIYYKDYSIVKKFLMETEGLIIAAQDHSLQTRNYQTNIKNGSNPIYWVYETKRNQLIT